MVFIGLDHANCDASQLVQDEQLRLKSL